MEGAYQDVQAIAGSPQAGPSGTSVETSEAGPRGSRKAISFVTFAHM